MQGKLLPYGHPLSKGGVWGVPYKPPLCWQWVVPCLCTSPSKSVRFRCKCCNCSPQGGRTGRRPTRKRRSPGECRQPL